MLHNLGGVVRRLFGMDYADGQCGSANINNRGDLCVASALPPKTELARLGNTWTCAIATASAFTYVAGYPTTRAELVLFNGNAEKSLVLESAFMYGITTMAAAQPITLVAQLALLGIAAPTDDTAQLIYSRSGVRQYPGQVKRAVANTAFMLANKWEVLGTSLVPAPTTNLAASLFVEMGGGWIVPPGGAIGFAGIAGTAAGTAIIGATWSEVKLPLTL